MVTHYPSASRGKVAIAEMHDDHLNNAVAKLQRATGRQHDPNMLQALKAEQARRAGASRL